MNQFDQAPVNGEAIEESIAIVCNGDTAPKAIAAGQYLFIKNHSTLATGGYHATDAIASGDTLSSSNVTSDPDGIANAINGKIPAVVNNLTSDSTTDALSAAQGKALNSKLQWKCHNIIQGTGNDDLPTNANEYLFILSYGTAPNVRQALSFTFCVPNDETRIAGYTLTDGYYLNSSAYAFAQMYVNCATHKANITSVNISGTEYNATSFMSVYYR